MAANGYPLNPPFEAQFDPERAQLFVITRLLRGVHTCDLVKVLAVTPTSGKVGFVTVQPLLVDTDTAGVLLAQSPIYNVPYFRYQGGSSAVILDPAVGDIGLTMFAQKDITHIKSTLAEGAPATARQHSTADALYVGGVLNPDPTQFVEFLPDAAGIKLTTPGALDATAQGAVSITTPATMTITAGALVINAPVTFEQTVVTTPTGAGNVTFGGTIIAPEAVIGGVTQTTHKHTGVQTGSGETGTPTN